MLNLNQFSDAKIFRQPFGFGVIEHPFSSDELAQDLAKVFPQDDYETREYGKGRFWRRPLIVKGENAIHKPEGLDPKMCSLGEIFLSQEYRATMSGATGLALENAIVEAWFWRYDANTEFVPHRDDETKMLTQVFYFMPVWSAKDGGNLLILNSESLDDVAYSITPTIELSTLIFRSDTSWHYLTPISPEAPCLRDSVTVHFHHP